MRECSKTCKKLDVSCPAEDCRMWIDYEEDLNCTLTAIDNNDDNHGSDRQAHA